jgi:hypothetical protein
MAAIANSPSFAKKVGVPQSVGKDFTTADKGRKFSKGGDTMASKMNPGFMAMMAKKKDGKKMAEGGKADLKQDKAMVKKAVGMHDKQQHMGKKTDLAMLKKGGGVKKMASGGMTSSKPSTASSRGDGIAQRGKTRGQMR